MTSGAKDVLRSAGGSLVSGRVVSRQYSLATVGSEQLDRDAVHGLDIWDVRDALEVAHAVDVFHDPERALARAIDVVGPYSTLDVSARTDSAMAWLWSVVRSRSMVTCASASIRWPIQRSRALVTRTRGDDQGEGGSEGEMAQTHGFDL